MVYEIKPRIPSDWSSQELRNAPRVKISVMGTFSRKYEKDCSIKVEDISVGGIRIKFISKVMPMNIGSLAKITVQFGRIKDGEILENVEVKLVWEKGVNLIKEFGFEFVNLSQELKGIIEKFIRKGI